MIGLGVPTHSRRARCLLYAVYLCHRLPKRGVRLLSHDFPRHQGMKIQES